MQRRQFLASAAAAATLGAAPVLASETLILTNDLWRVRVDPATLAIHIQPAGQPELCVSEGLPPRATDVLHRSADTVRWQWSAAAGQGPLQIEIVLLGRDLNLTLKAMQAETCDLLNQPATAIGRGLILPIAEGRYASADNAEWRSELLNGHNDLNSTEDLTLPLWGMDHGDFTLHWLLTNPFNNRLHFSDTAAGLSLKLRHDFIRLAPQTPMTLTLHLGEDLLSGARRYKQRLIDCGQFQTLADKIRVTPDSAKLIGAPQTFLWGTGLIGVHDVMDWPGFVSVLKGKSPLATRLRVHVNEEIRAQLLSTDVPANAYAKTVRVRALNEALLAAARAEWQVAVINLARMVSVHGELKSQVRDTFGATLTPDSATWGQALSQRTLTSLKQAGLDRLWIGLAQGWEGGLWHPETVRAAVKAGYVVGPYDGYDTIIAPGEHPDWATGQQGRLNYDSCGIMKADGTIWTGFANTGHYSNPNCYGPHMKARVAAISGATGYNGWYLDVTASGMVFDDYRPGHEMTMAENAAANVAAQTWLTRDRQMVTSSEVGNAVTSQGIAFAQGTQTPVMGWGDADLLTNSTSPHYLGGWFPPEQPGKFFKSAVSKPKYRALHFAPGVVIPLYQAVFHGSIITTHHWTYDNIKLTDVAQDRELCQLLFNVAPTWHLSEATLDQRIPLIKRQYAAFKEMHEALALHGLTGFDWLSDDKRLQRTTFADGSCLTANFDSSERHTADVSLPPLSLQAHFADGRTLLFQTQPIA